MKNNAKFTVNEILEQAKVNQAISAPMYRLASKMISDSKGDEMSLDAMQGILNARIDAYKDSEKRKEFCKKLVDILLKCLKM